MMAARNDGNNEAVERIHNRLDKFSERLDKLEGEISLIARWLEKIESRNERVEEYYAQIKLYIGKMQVEVEQNKALTDRLQKSIEAGADENKEIILQLLENERSVKEQYTHLLNAEKNRKQERFLKIWAIIGPVIASLITTVVSKLIA